MVRCTTSRLRLAAMIGVETHFLGSIPRATSAEPAFPA
jgi:hypothetical protein